MSLWRENADHISQRRKNEIPVPVDEMKRKQKRGEVER